MPYVVLCDRRVSDIKVAPQDIFAPDCWRWVTQWVPPVCGAGGTQFFLSCFPSPHALCLQLVAFEYDIRQMSHAGKYSTFPAKQTIMSVSHPRIT